MEQLAISYVGQGKFDKARHFCEQVLLSRKTTSEDEWMDTLPLQFMYTRIILTLGRYQEALERHNVIHQQVINRLNFDNPLILDSLEVYVRMFEWSSDQVMVQWYCREMVHMTMSAFGLKYQRTQQAISLLARSMTYHERFAESEKLYAIMIQLSQTLVSPFPFKELCYALKNLAYSIDRQSRPAEALGLYRSFSLFATSNLGVEHPIAMEFQRELGYSLRRNLLLRESEESLRQCEEVYIRVLGLDNRDTLANIIHLGGLLCQMSRYEDGIAKLEFALPRIRELAGSMHAESIYASSELGNGYVQFGNQRKEQGRLKEALTLIQKGSQIHLTGLPSLFESIYWSRAQLGDCYIAIGTKLEEAEKVDEAIRWFKRGITTSRHCIGSKCALTIWASYKLGTELTNLGILFQKQGDLEEATKHYRRGYLTFLHDLGPNHEPTITSCENHRSKYAEYGTILEARGDDATKWFKQGFSTHLECLGPCHEKTLGSCVELKDYYMRQTRYTDALLLCTTFYEKVRSTEGDYIDILEQIQEWIAALSILINEEGYLDPGWNDFGFSSTQVENESDSEDDIEMGEIGNEMDDNMVVLLDSLNEDTVVDV